MKKGIIITIILVIVLIVGAVIGVFAYNKHKEKSINESANFLYEKLKTEENKVENLETGMYFDFSKTELKYDGLKPSEGIVFIDENKDIQIISNIKIKDRYCVLSNEEFTCSKDFTKDSNINPTTNKKYNIGDAVTLSDGSKWHVIHNSDEYSKYVTLILDTRIDYNKDNFILDTGSTKDFDRVPFSKDGLKKYDVTDTTGIAYYLENTYKSQIPAKVLNIRIPYQEEIIAIEEAIGFTGLTEEQIRVMTETEFNIVENLPRDDNYELINLNTVVISAEDYTKLMPHYLYNSFSGNYWLMPKDNKLTTTIWSGDGFMNSKPTTGRSIKPIITIEKTDIK